MLCKLFIKLIKQKKTNNKSISTLQSKTSLSTGVLKNKIQSEIMDIFQLIGDFLHLIAIVMLFLKILANKNVIGISYRTQEIYLIVFLTRYSDMILQNHWGSIYFNIMRFVFIGITAYTMYLIRLKRPFKLSYENQSDKFPHWVLYLIAVGLALVFHKKFTLYGIFWAFSIWLEAMAILPQLYMIAKFQNVENITAHVVLFLGFYRIFYVLHWIYNWQHIVLVSFSAGIIQSILYADFIWYFIKSNNNQKIIKIPI